MNERPTFLYPEDSKLFTPRKRTDFIVAHVTASAYGKALTAKDIDREHRQRGFVAIGYHFIIHLDGTLEGARPMDTVGAHVENHNSNSVAFSFVGGLGKDGQPADTRTPEQKETAAKVIEYLMVLYPEASLIGHRDFSPDLNKDGKLQSNEWIKACPCHDVRRWWKQVAPPELRGRVAGQMAEA